MYTSTILNTQRSSPNTNTLHARLTHATLHTPHLTRYTYPTPISYHQDLRVDNTLSYKTHSYLSAKHYNLTYCITIFSAKAYIRSKAGKYKELGVVDSSCSIQSSFCKSVDQAERKKFSFLPSLSAIGPEENSPRHHQLPYPHPPNRFGGVSPFVKNHTEIHLPKQVWGEGWL